MPSRLISQRRRLPLFALLLLLGLAGCDTVDSNEPVVLFADVDVFRFTFEADAIDANSPAVLTADAEVDLAAFLRQQGFTKDEVISATVSSARLEIIFPVSETADFMDEAILLLDADGLPTLEVAEQTSFPSDNDEVTLTVRSGRDVADYVQAPTFTSVLRIDPARLEAGEDYELVAVLRLRIEVEGV